MKRYTWQAIAVFYSLAINPILAQDSASISTPDTPTYSALAGKVETTDTNPIELGVKFRTSVNGQVSAVRFYRDVPIDSGYTVHLWDASTGQMLAQGAVIEGQGPTPGWQTIQLYDLQVQSGRNIIAGKTYIASYYASTGNYTVSENFFTQMAIQNGPLYLLSAGEEGGNGVFAYGGGFPNETYNGSNYWVDVIFKPTSTQ